MILGNKKTIFNVGVLGLAASFGVTMFGCGNKDDTDPCNELIVVSQAHQDFFAQKNVGAISFADDDVAKYTTAHSDVLKGTYESSSQNNTQCDLTFDWGGVSQSDRNANPDLPLPSKGYYTPAQDDNKGTLTVTDTITLSGKHQHQPDLHPVDDDRFGPQ